MCKIEQFLVGKAALYLPLSPRRSFGCALDSNDMLFVVNDAMHTMLEEAQKCDNNSADKRQMHVVIGLVTLERYVVITIKIQLILVPTPRPTTIRTKRQNSRKRIHIIIARHSNRIKFITSLYRPLKHFGPSIIFIPSISPRVPPFCLVDHRPIDYAIHSPLPFFLPKYREVSPSGKSRMESWSSR